MTRKTTKRALLTSVISMLICIVMLVGTTFAWFTDSVSSVNNVIKSGNLDVELYYQNDTTTTWTKVGADTNIFKTGTLWEPGHTEVVKLKVVNEGTLALKYDFGINIDSEVGSVNVYGDPFKLSQYIYFGVVNGEQNYTRETAIAAVAADAKPIAGGKTIPGNLEGVKDGVKSESVVTLVVYMPTTVDNRANYAKDAAVPTINLGLNVFATQYTSEYDSFGKDYDEKAPEMYSVNGTTYDTADAALAAANDGDKVYLSPVTAPIVVDKKIELTVAMADIEAGDGVNAITVNTDATIAFEGVNTLVGGKNADGIYVAEGAKLTLTGKGKLVTKGNAGLEYYTKTVNGVEYGDYFSNTTDTSYSGKGGSGIDVAGEILITDLADLTAEGYGVHGFGIGGASENITIKNTTVTYARGGYAYAGMIIPESWGNYYYGKGEPTGGAAIGSSTDGAVITLDKATVKLAEGGSKGAGIGAMYHTGVTVNITDSTVTALGGNASAGIGGSRVVQYATSADAITVNVTNSTINAVGGEYAAAIGSGYNTYADKMSTLPATTVTIDAASTVIAQGGKLGAGIGTGHNVVNFVGDIKCDTTNVKAGDSNDECCLGNAVSSAQDVGVGAYRIDQLYTSVDDGFYTDGEGNYYVYNAVGLSAMRTWMLENFNNEMWGKTYNIMADIDATGVTWAAIHMAPDSSTFNGITLNGNGHTIKNLTITTPDKTVQPHAADNAGLFTSTTQGTAAGTTPATFTDLTFDNVTVNGGSFHNGVIWGEAHGSITLDNVHVINSTVSGGCNVGALVGRNNGNATVKFIDCSVKNTTVNATEAADYSGASSFLGMALKIGTSTSIDLIFEGNNTADNVTLNTASGMQGGGVYTKAEWGTPTWKTPAVVNDFTNYNSNN